MQRKLYRLPEEAMVAGVAAGLARYLEMNVGLTRLLFVALVFLTAGAAVIAYIVLAIIMPTPGAAKSAGLDVGERVESLASELKTSGRVSRAGNYVGIALILLGAWLLIGQVFPSWFDMQWSLVWPVAVILLGVWIISKGRNS